MMLKQSLKNHLIVSGFTSSISIIIFFSWWYFNFDSSILLGAGLFHLFFTIPAIFIHIKYYLKNAGEEIEITNYEIVIKKNGDKRIYNFKDLEKIIVYKSASLDGIAMPLSAMEYYRYARITTRTGEEIIITCLMTLDMENVVKKLSGVPYERKKVIAFPDWR